MFCGHDGKKMKIHANFQAMNIFVRFETQVWYKMQSELNVINLRLLTVSAPINCETHLPVEFQKFSQIAQDYNMRKLSEIETNQQPFLSRHAAYANKMQERLVIRQIQRGKTIEDDQSTDDLSININQCMAGIELLSLLKIEISKEKMIFEHNLNGIQVRNEFTVVLKLFFNKFIELKDFQSCEVCYKYMCDKCSHSNIKSGVILLPLEWQNIMISTCAKFVSDQNALNFGIQLFHQIVSSSDSNTKKEYLEMHGDKNQVIFDREWNYLYINAILCCIRSNSYVTGDLIINQYFTDIRSSIKILKHSIANDPTSKKFPIFTMHTRSLNCFLGFYHRCGNNFSKLLKLFQWMCTHKKYDHISYSIILAFYSLKYEQNLTFMEENAEIENNPGLEHMLPLMKEGIDQQFNTFIFHTNKDEHRKNNKSKYKQLPKILVLNCGLFSPLIFYFAKKGAFMDCLKIIEKMIEYSNNGKNVEQRSKIFPYGKLSKDIEHQLNPLLNIPSQLISEIPLNLKNKIEIDPQRISQLFDDIFLYKNKLQCPMPNANMFFNVIFCLACNSVWNENETNQRVKWLFIDWILHIMRVVYNMNHMNDEKRFYGILIRLCDCDLNKAMKYYYRMISLNYNSIQNVFNNRRVIGENTNEPKTSNVFLCDFEHNFGNSTDFEMYFDGGNMSGVNKHNFRYAVANPIEICPSDLEMSNLLRVGLKFYQEMENKNEKIVKIERDLFLKWIFQQMQQLNIQPTDYILQILGEFHCDEQLESLTRTTL